ncbi:MAG: AI-2E family transporter [Gemmatimonadales bacterium]
MTFFDSKHQRAALLLTLLGVVLAIALAPYATGLIAVPVLYVVLHPLHRWLARAIGRRPAAVLAVVLTVLLVVLPGISVVGLLVDRAQDMARQVAAGRLLERIGSLKVGPLDIGERLVQMSEQVVRWLGGNALSLVGTATRFALNLLLALFGLYYLLINGAETWEGVRPYIPFSRANTDRLQTRFRDVTVSTVIGTGMTATAQGLAVALSFAFTGLSDPLFWGVVTIVFAVLPVLGSGMVWIPAVAVLALDGRPGAAAFLAGWNVGATAVIDYVARPIIYNRFAQIHPLITLVGAVAGVSYLGLLGLLVGPLALSYFFAILKMYREEYVPAGSASGFTSEIPVADPVVPAPADPVLEPALEPRRDVDA